MGTLKFTWNEQKALSNQQKHGISFEEAKTVFYDAEGLLIHDPDHTDEERFIMLGVSATVRLLIVCHCYRESEQVIRIISARKASRSEIATYNGGIP